MKNLILLFMIFTFVMPVNAVCMLDEPCAMSDNTLTVENEMNIEAEQTQEQKQKINFMPSYNQNIPRVSPEYDSRPSSIFQQTPPPRNCMFGLCLP